MLKYIFISMKLNMQGCKASIFMAASLLIAAGASGQLKYPETKKVNQVDDYFGTKVSDPYRWLEDPPDPTWLRR